MPRRLLLLSVLVYVTLDLSMAGMPGAFVFEPADSVESAHGARARGVAPLVAIPVAPEDRSTPPPRPSATVAALTASAPVPRARRVVGVLPRAVLPPVAADDVD